MRPYRNLILLAFLTSLASLAAVPAAWPAQDDGRLDGLFERLRVTPDAVEASALEARIWRIWLRSPEAKVNHLMAGGISRMDRGGLAEGMHFVEAFRRYGLGRLNQDRDAASAPDGNHAPAPDFRHRAVHGQQGNGLPGRGHRQKFKVFVAHCLILTIYIFSTAGVSWKGIRGVYTNFSHFKVISR